MVNSGDQNHSFKTPVWGSERSQQSAHRPSVDGWCARPRCATSPRTSRVWPSSASGCRWRVPSAFPACLVWGKVANTLYDLDKRFLYRNNFLIHYWRQVMDLLKWFMFHFSLKKIQQICPPYQKTRFYSPQSCHFLQSWCSSLFLFTFVVPGVTVCMFYWVSSRVSFAAHRAGRLGPRTPWAPLRHLRNAPSGAERLRMMPTTGASSETGG